MPTRSPLLRISMSFYLLFCLRSYYTVYGLVHIGMYIVQTIVVDPHHVDADPDSTYHTDADPDSDFYLMRIQIRIFTLMRIRIHSQILAAK